MSRVVRLLAALLLLTVLSGADGCNRVRSDRPERQEHPRNERKATIRIYNATGPYEVLVIAHELDKQGTDRTGPELVASGDYEQELTYSSGLRIEILAQAKGHSDDRFTCEIADGARVDRRTGKGQVNCQLITSQ